MWRAATAVAERHGGGVTSWNPAAGVVLPPPLEPPCRGACPSFAPYPMREALAPSFTTETIQQ